MHDLVAQAFPAKEKTGFYKQHSLLGYKQVRSFFSDLTQNQIDGLEALARGLINDGRPDITIPVRADDLAELIARLKKVSRATHRENTR